MGVKTKAKAEFGDFQTPTGLAETVCRLLAQQGLQPRSLLEPTCGYGTLLFAGIQQFTTIEKALGTDINPDHLRQAEVTRDQLSATAQVTLNEADFFDNDWKRVIADLPEPVLLLGNPPWVTNAGQRQFAAQIEFTPTQWSRRNHGQGQL